MREWKGYEQNRLPKDRGRFIAELICNEGRIRSQASFACRNQQEKLLLKHAKEKQSAKITETTFYIFVSTMCQELIGVTLHYEVWLRKVLLADPFVLTTHDHLASKHLKQKVSVKLKVEKY